MFGIDTNLCIFVVAGLAGLYTIVGGLLAVMWTESIQTIILLTGAISITLFGLQHIGGWEGLQDSVHPVNFSIIRPSSDPTGLSKWAVFLGYPVIGLWYWCCDQVIVQRVLAAKDENHARIGPLFAGFIKILPVFIFVLPGLICLGLVNSKAKGFTDPLGDPKDTLTYLINHLLPTGLKGIMAAALLAAMMGSVSAALNSIATVFSYDVVKRWRPETSEHRLVLSGRIVTAVAMALSIAWSPLVGRFETIFQGVNDLTCYMAPPVTVVFLFGVFWRRASSKAAIVTLLSGSALGLMVFMLQLFLADMVPRSELADRFGSSRGSVGNPFDDLRLRDVLDRVGHVDRAFVSLPGSTDCGAYGAGMEKPLGPAAREVVALPGQLSRVGRAAVFNDRRAVLAILGFGRLLSRARPSSARW